MTTVSVYERPGRREQWQLEDVGANCITLSRGARLATFDHAGNAQKGATGRIAPGSLRQLRRQLSRAAATQGRAGHTRSSGNDNRSTQA